MNKSSLNIWGVCVITLAFMLSMQEGTSGVHQDPYIKEMQSILAGPTGDTVVQMRVTSRFEDSRITTRNITLTQQKKQGYFEYLIKVSSTKKSLLICLRCNSEGKATTCNKGASPIPKVGMVKDTLLPWDEITGGICNQWYLNRLDNTNKGQAVIKIVPDHALSWKYSLAYFRADKLPVKFERFGEDGSLIRIVKVLEARRSIWGTGVKRSLFIRPQKKEKVLIEILSLSALENDKEFLDELLEKD